MISATSYPPGGGGVELADNIDSVELQKER